MLLGGILFSVIPYLGAMLSFGSPLVALIAIIVGGLGLKQAKEQNASTGAATAGIIVGVVSLIPGIIVALTCGLCNAAVSSDMSGGSLKDLNKDLQKTIDQANREALAQRQQPPVPPLPEDFAMAIYTEAISDLSDQARKTCKVKEQLGLYLKLEVDHVEAAKEEADSPAPKPGALPDDTPAAKVSVQRVSSVSIHTLAEQKDDAHMDPTKVTIAVDEGRVLGEKVENACLSGLAENIVISPIPESGPVTDHLVFAIPIEDTDKTAPLPKTP